jgi:Family of unknown function (DUF6134)
LGCAMGRSSTVWVCAVLVGAVSAINSTPLLAAPQIYEYRVVHPVYGDIGTYTNIVQKAGDTTEVESKLDVEVKILGVVMYSEAAERSEHWQNGRLLSFHGVTDMNDRKLEVKGEARGNSFVITSPTGTVVAPANVHPSNPSPANLLNTDTMMSSKTGELFKVRVIGGAVERAMTDGHFGQIRRYEIDSDIRQYVWLDDQGVPVAFRTEDDDTFVDFLLIRYPSGKPAPWSVSPPDDSIIAASVSPQSESRAIHASYEH